MSDKIVAGFVTAAIITPLCAVCILGPVAFGSFIAGVFGWFTGLDPLAMLGLSVIGSIIGFAYFSRRKTGMNVHSEERRPLESISAQPRE